MQAEVSLTELEQPGAVPRCPKRKHQGQDPTLPS